MNKIELASAVAEKAGFSKVDGKKAVNAFIDVIQEEIEKGESVSILGFGTFGIVEKSARKGVNPATGAAINIPARKVVKFKVGANLAGAVK
jgi:DNA-binding protein HU-beta